MKLFLFKIVLIVLFFIFSIGVLNNYQLNKGHKIDNEELKCLSDTIYHEAKGEGEQGWLGVASVIRNRINHPKFPSTICEIVHQKKQFTWNRNSKIDDAELYRKIQNFSEYFLVTNLEDNTNGAIFYHATHLGERWKDKTVIINRHVFFKKLN